MYTNNKLILHNRFSCLYCKSSKCSIKHSRYSVKWSNSLSYIEFFYRTKPTMGKGGNQKKNKNVFKVAGARSLKAKKKAKAVTTNIKKLNEITKQGTEEVDKLLDVLQETVRKPLPVTNKEKTPDPKVKEDREGKIEQFKKDAENSVEALDKLNKMEF